MHKFTEKWHNSSWFPFALAGLLLIALVVLLPLYFNHRHLVAELNKVRQEAENRETKIAEMVFRISKLRNDPEAVEQLARELYNYCRPGEKIRIYNEK